MDSWKCRTRMGSSSLGVVMSEIISSFRSKLDLEAVRERFPEISDSETPIWHGSPALMSMSGKYALAGLVLVIHLVFYWAAKYDTVIEGEANLNLVVGLAKTIIDISGVLGFAIMMLLVAKVNHYLNTSTSGGWTTSWLLINGLIPLIWYITTLINSFLIFIGYHGFDHFIGEHIPVWKDWYYLVLGVFSSISAVALTAHYSNAFQYAITDKRVHIRKKFLYFDSSTVGIPFEKVENLKVEPSIIGRIFGFGNIHVITDGMQSNISDDNVSIKQSSFLNPLSWIFIQRKNNPSSQDPSECLYCINEPMSVYALINELIDNS